MTNAKTTTKAEQDVAKAPVGGKPDATEDEPKVGKVEARLSALEAYIKANHKAMGWPEFKG